MRFAQAHASNSWLRSQAKAVTGVDGTCRRTSPATHAARCLLHASVSRSVPTAARRRPCAALHDRTDSTPMFRWSQCGPNRTVAALTATAHCGDTEDTPVQRESPAGFSTRYGPLHTAPPRGAAGMRLVVWTAAEASLAVTPITVAEGRERYGHAVSTRLRVSHAALCDATDREAVLGGYYSTRRVLQYPAGITVPGGPTLWSTGCEYRRVRTAARPPAHTATGSAPIIR